jgi:glycerol-3-phosphate dehydrogenase subunit C
VIPFDSPKFEQPAAFDAETLRVYDICNGCRRCFNLCPSFDVLFRGIDDKDGEVGSLEAPVLDQVVDLCYYCKLCFNHCPYCPPHDYDLDFPRLMIWGKYLKAKQKQPSLRDRLLVNVEGLGRLGGLIAPALNSALRQSWVRRLSEAAMGIHRDRLLPLYHRQSFSTWFSLTGKRGAAEKGNGKAALFYTCYVNQHDPGIGKAAVQVLRKNGVEVSCPKQECCGMPYFDTGDLESVRKKAAANIAWLEPAVDAGYTIIAPMPTCSLMLKKEYPDLIPTEAAKKIAAHTMDLCEYLMRLESEGKLSKDFVWKPEKIAYQVPCHLRDQNIGFKSRDLMKLTGAKVHVIERCTGHDGSFGVKKEFYELSVKVGRKAFGEAERGEAEVVSSDCPLSGLALTQATGKRSLHPIEIIQRAYGMKP